MKILYFLLLIILGPQAWAYECLPKDWGGTGSSVHISTSDASGTWMAWACPAKMPDGSPGFTAHWFVVLKAMTPQKINPIIAAMSDGQTSLDAVNAMLPAGTVSPANPKQVKDFNRMRDAAVAYANSVSSLELK